MEAVTQNRKEKDQARAIQQHLEVPYTRALRLLREGSYAVADDGTVTQAPDRLEPHRG